MMLQPLGPAGRIGFQEGGGRWDLRHSPIVAGDVTTPWDPQRYPEVHGRHGKEIVKAVGDMATTLT